MCSRQTIRISTSAISRSSSLRTITTKMERRVTVARLAVGSITNACLLQRASSYPSHSSGIPAIRITGIERSAAHPPLQWMGNQSSRRGGGRRRRRRSGLLSAYIQTSTENKTDQRRTPVPQSPQRCGNRTDGRGPLRYRSALCGPTQETEDGICYKVDVAGTRRGLLWGSEEGRSSYLAGKPAADMPRKLHELRLITVLHVENDT